MILDQKHIKFSFFVSCLLLVGGTSLGYTVLTLIIQTVKNDGCSTLNRKEINLAHGLFECN